jgi:hypothetical protein
VSDLCDRCVSGNEPCSFRTEDRNAGVPVFGCVYFKRVLPENRESAYIVATRRICRTCTKKTCMIAGTYRAAVECPEVRSIVMGTKSCEGVKIK